jgi:MFS family permease
MSGEKIYRGWFVLLGSFLVFTSASMVHTTFGLFAVPAAKELHISYADANTWLIVMGLASACLSPFVGRLVDRVSARLIMAIGGVVLAASFAGIGLTSYLPLMMALAIPVAFASDSAGGLAASTVTARWFRRRRGRALALVGISASAAGFIFSPIAAWLIVTYSWRTALTGLGLFSCTMILLMAFLLVRDRPTPEQLQASEAFPPGAELPASTEERQWSFGRLVRERNFLLLSFGIGLLFASDRSLLISVAPYLNDQGVDLKMAGLLASVLMGSSIVGKLVVGAIADYVDPRRIFLVVAGLHLVLLVSFLVQPGYWVLFGISLVSGLGIGGVLPVNQVLTARVFGSASFGAVIGTAAVVHQLIMMISFRFIGEVRDRTGDYSAALQTFIVFVVISAILVSLVRLDESKAPMPEVSPVPA